MPLMMMDESLDVDDLFGDPASLDLGLTSSTPSTVKGLSQHLDELRLFGCCQKIAWSRLGAIVHISPDGQRVFLRHLASSPEDGKWSLNHEKPPNQIAEANEGHTFIHLAWNEAGSDLAIADSCGRVLIVSMSIALNILGPSRLALNDSDDDGNQLVGLMWLSMNRPVHAFSKAVRTSGRWAYSRYPRRPVGAFHPLNKSALICITRSGSLKLLYQNQESKWGETSLELHNTGDSDKILTHASLFPTEGGSILIATYTVSEDLRIYRAQVKWEGPSQQESAQKPNNYATTPTLALTHIKVEKPKLLFRHPKDSPESPGNPVCNPTSSFNLTHMEIITNPSAASPPGAAANLSATPFIFAVFSSPLHSPENKFHLAEPSSILAYWEFSSTTQNLHPCFDNITSKAMFQQAKPKTELRKLGDVYFDKHVIAIDYMEAASALAIAFSDGSISFYDSKTMTPLDGFHDIDTVTSMAQAGFSFNVDVDSGVHMAFSPNGCLAAFLDTKSQLQLRIMQHSFGAENGLFNEGEFTSAVASLTLTYSRACGNDCNFDDVLMIVVQQLTPDAQNGFINEVYRALSMNVDYTLEQDKLMNNPYIQKSLSMQAAFGFPSKYDTRPLAAAVAWITLQLRQTSILLAYFHFNKGGSEAECYDADILRMVYGNVKWALDLAKFLVDELCETADTLDQPNSDPMSLQAKNFASLPVLLVLTSIPRSFLKYICRGLRGLSSGFRSATNISNESYAIYYRIVTLIAESPLKVDVYEKLLASIDNVVKQTYQSAGFSNVDRATPERDLLVTGNIPPVLQPAVVTILTKTIPMVRNEANLMQLCLQDYSWLSIGDDQGTRMFKRKFELDILKKVPLALDDTVKAARRRCVRCCAASEDVTSPKSWAAFRMLVRTVVMRSCACGGVWTMENVRSLDNSSVAGWRQSQ